VIRAAAMILLALAAEDAPVAVEARLTPPEIPYHRTARLDVVAEVPAEESVAVADIAGAVGTLAVNPLSEQSKIETLRNGRKRVTMSYTLDAIWPGDYPIAPLRVTLSDGAETVVPGPVLRVRELTPEEEEAAQAFVPNAGPVDPPFRVWETWWGKALVAVATLAALVALVMAGFAWWRRRKERALRAAPPVPPWETAYARLRALDARGLPGQGQSGPYYVELTSILRQYIEDRFTLHAPEETTPEFLSEAARSGALSQDHQRLLSELLRHADRVKFARYEPTVNEMERSMALVLQFVDETVPGPVAGEEAA
jgi:hypothetical protein